MYSVKYIVLLSSLVFSCFSMKRVETFTEDLGDTAYFKTESVVNSPLCTPRVSPRLDLTTLEQTPRAVTSCLYALMHKYEVDVAKCLVSFPDYLESDKMHSIPISLVSEWVKVLKVDTSAHAQTSPVVDVLQTNADQRDLQHARKKLYEFITCRDLVPAMILVKRYNRLLETTRRVRLTAFEQQDICSIVGAKYLSVHYHHLTSHELEQNPLELYQDFSKVKKLLCGTIL